RLHGFQAAEHIGRKLSDLVHAEDGHRLLTALAKATEQAGPAPAIEYRAYHVDGRCLTVETVINNLLDDANVRGLVLTSRNVTEQKLLEDQLAHQALHDPLTNLPNRALFRDRVNQALAHAHRRGERIGIIWIDLDNFKTVNDSLGHAAGDSLLV